MFPDFAVIGDQLALQFSDALQAFRASAAQADTAQSLALDSSTSTYLNSRDQRTPVSGMTAPLSALTNAGSTFAILRGPH